MIGMKANLGYRLRPETKRDTASFKRRLMRWWKKILRFWQWREIFEKSSDEFWRF